MPHHLIHVRILTHRDRILIKQEHEVTDFLLNVRGDAPTDFLNPIARD